MSTLLGYESLKSAPKRVLKGGFVLPKSSFGEHGLFNFSNALEKLKSANLRLGEKTNADFYAPQTKVLEGLTKDEIPVFDILFNGL